MHVLRKHSLLNRFGLTLWCLLALWMLLGCSSAPVVRTTILAPPIEFMQDCPEPEALERPVTNGGLLTYTLDVRTALRLCNADKLGLRTWLESVNK